MCKNAVKKLSFEIRHIPQQYKPQQMWDTAILED